MMQHSQCQGTVQPACATASVGLAPDVCEVLSCGCWLTSLQLTAVQPACLTACPLTLAQQQHQHQQQHQPGSQQPAYEQLHQSESHNLLLHVSATLSGSGLMQNPCQQSAQPAMYGNQAASRTGQQQAVGPLVVPTAQASLFKLATPLPLQDTMLELVVLSRQMSVLLQKQVSLTQLVQQQASLHTSTAAASGAAPTSNGSKQSHLQQLLHLGKAHQGNAANSSLQQASTSSEEGHSCTVHLNVQASIPLQPSAHPLDWLHLVLTVRRPEVSAASAAPPAGQSLLTAGVVAQLPLLIMPASAQQEIQQLMLPAMRQEVQAEQQQKRRLLQQQQQQQPPQQQQGKLRQQDFASQCMELEHAVWFHYSQLAYDMYAVLQLCAAVAVEAAAAAACATTADEEAASEPVSAAAAFAAPQAARQRQVAAVFRRTSTLDATINSLTPQSTTNSANIDDAATAAVAFAAPAAAGTHNSNAGATSICPSAETASTQVASVGVSVPGCTAGAALAQVAGALVLPLLLPFLAAHGLHNTLQLLLANLPPQLQQAWQQQQVQRLQEFIARGPIAAHQLPDSDAELSLCTTPVILAVQEQNVTFDMHQGCKPTVDEQQQATAGKGRRAADCSKGVDAHGATGSRRLGLQHRAKQQQAVPAAADVHASSSKAIADVGKTAVACGNGVNKAADAVPWWSPLTQFAEAGMEQRYVAWKHEGMLQVDYWGAVLGVMYTSAVLLRMVRDRTAAVHLVYTLSKQLSWMPLLINKADFYFRRRELLVFGSAPTSASLLLLLVMVRWLLPGRSALLLPSRAISCHWSWRGELTAALIRPAFMHMRLRLYIVYILLDFLLRGWLLGQVAGVWAASHMFGVWGTACVVTISVGWAMELWLRRRFVGELHWHGCCT